MYYRQRNRHRVEILLEILKNARTPIPPTKINSRCNLSYTVTRKMTGFLVERGFLERLPPPESRVRRDDKKNRQIVNLYVITEKGVQLLELVEGSTLAELSEYGRETEG